MAALEHADILQRLIGMEGWSLEAGRITKTYAAPSFHRAAGFVTQIAIIADAADHHPDIDIRYNKVIIRLSTHSEEGITTKDFSLAASIDEAFAQ
ncbi:MAG: 4a-hydroxytetrahydrobiopterin dehydratase [Bacteroidetes bacterium]|nr:4a-hydroxytetrahydrobiopterin dehydratase [Bacteroidota bacterium]